MDASFSEMGGQEFAVGSILIRKRDGAVLGLGRRKSQETASETYGHGFARHQKVLSPSLSEQDQPAIDDLVSQSARLLGQLRLAGVIVNHVHHGRFTIEL